jgi:hypothetical protein
MTTRRLRALQVGALSATLLAAGVARAAPWFGQVLPPPVNDPTKPVLSAKDDLPPQPATFGPGPKSPLLAGDRIESDVATIVGFSLESRAAGDYLWGRMSGAPAYYETVGWAVDQLRKAGLADAHLEDFPATLSTPLSGEARVLGDPSFGEGSGDVVLQSAMVEGRGPVNGGVTAPLIYVGHASPADLLGRDVKGKIAVIHSQPDPGLFGAPEIGRPAALMKAGAAGVIEILDQIGNMQSYDADRHGCGVQLCFTVGGADGFFLENMLGKGGMAGKTVSARLSAGSALRTGLKSANGVATLPGKTDRTIIIDAHADAYFVGADDNASGLATQLALARYFASQPKLDHTLVFVVSAGHHTQGMGLPNFRLRHEADYVARADLIINLEHVANMGLVRGQGARQADDYGAPMVATTTEFPKSVAVSNRAPFLIDVWRQGAKCFGLSIQRVVDVAAPGELGAFTSIEAMAARNPELAAADLKNLAVPVTQMISAGPLYHTSGETIDAVPGPGLERAARFHAYLIQAADEAAPELLLGAPWTPRLSCPATP